MTEQVSPTDDETNPSFANEVDRVRESGALGQSGRLRELFDFLAARGMASQPASQAEIAEEVFGQVDSDGDDATVRVYVHRLRKRLDQFYQADQEEAPNGRLIVPAGTYGLRFAAPESTRRPLSRQRTIRRTWLVVVAGLVMIAGAFGIGMALARGEERSVNAIWQPFIDAERPILVVVGDYYMFGEIDPLRPEEGRLIRDFRINSPTDLARLKAEESNRYDGARDVGLTYPPLSSADALRSLMPVLARDDQPVAVIPASQLDGVRVQNFNIVYVGLLSGLGMLEDVNFMNSNFATGETYDELIHLPSDGRFVSGEAQALPMPVYYTDYGYLSVFREPGGGLIAVVAGARDTALRSIAAQVASDKLPAQLLDVVDQEASPAYEALFEITGQKGADLSERLVLAERRPNS